VRAVDWGGAIATQATEVAPRRGGTRSLEDTGVPRRARDAPREAAWKTGTRAETPPATDIAADDSAAERRCFSNTRSLRVFFLQRRSRGWPRLFSFSMMEIMDCLPPTTSLASRRRPPFFRVKIDLTRLSSFRRVDGKKKPRSSRRHNTRRNPRASPRSLPPYALRPFRFRTHDLA
jgi:hypothetical protein